MVTRGKKIQSEVLEVLGGHTSALSAYDLLEELRKTNPKIAPPTIYRALAALMEQRRVHRIESLNAFMACQCGYHQNDSILLICEVCGTVKESVMPDILTPLSKIIGKSDFLPSRHVIEVHGVCASCAGGQEIER